MTYYAPWRVLFSFTLENSNGRVIKASKKHRIRLASYVYLTVYRNNMEKRPGDHGFMGGAACGICSRSNSAQGNYEEVIRCLYCMDWVWPFVWSEHALEIENKNINVFAFDPFCKQPIANFYGASSIPRNYRIVV